jgi:hypothetical protein
MTNETPTNPTPDHVSNLKDDIKEIGKDIKGMAADALEAAHTIHKGSTDSVKKAVKDFKAK